MLKIKITFDDGEIVFLQANAKSYQEWTKTFHAASVYVTDSGHRAGTMSISTSKVKHTTLLAVDE